MLALQNMVTSAPANNNLVGLRTARTALQMVVEMVSGGGGGEMTTSTSKETATPTTSPSAATATPQPPAAAAAAASSLETTVEESPAQLHDRSIVTAIATATTATAAAAAARRSIQPPAASPREVVAVQALPRLPEHIDLTSDTEPEEEVEDQFFDAHESPPPLFETHSLASLRLPPPPPPSSSRAEETAAPLARSRASVAAAAAVAVRWQRPPTANRDTGGRFVPLTGSDSSEARKRKAVEEPVVASGSGSSDAPDGPDATDATRPLKPLERWIARGGPLVAHRSGTQQNMRARVTKSLNRDFTGEQAQRQAQPALAKATVKVTATAAAAAADPTVSAPPRVRHITTQRRERDSFPATLLGSGTVSVR